MKRRTFFQIMITWPLLTNVLFSNDIKNPKNSQNPKITETHQDGWRVIRVDGDWHIHKTVVIDNEKVHIIANNIYVYGCIAFYVTESADLVLEVDNIYIKKKENKPTNY